MSCRFCWTTSCGLLFALLSPLKPDAALADAPAADRVDFNRDIRPILSDKCFRCHGPDDEARQAGLRLDLKQRALSKLESGAVAVVPGDADESELFQRVSSTDPDVKMPPPASKKKITAGEVALLKKWIDQGAQWRGHWSFIKPERPTPPAVRNDANVANPIDRFILARLDRAGLAPAAEADKTTLIRRVTLDLTGLPPTLAEIDAFLADDSPEAYERLVRRLLDSPRYGEQMARYWLDAARYGDTHGLHLDNERSIWPYRDWVISAFNRNMPFDQFTIEQLAGDLLPNATLQQRVATGFNRCNVTTSEGGSIAEEYYVRYAVDRVETTSTVWMGLTAGCAVCHDHKFDPITQKEFYQLFAFFNNTQDKPMDGNALLPPPSVKIATREQQQQRAEYEAQVADVSRRIQDALRTVRYEDPGLQETPPPEPVEVVWIEDALPPGAKPQPTPADWRFVSAPDHPVYSGESASTRNATGLSQHFFTGANPGLKIAAGDTLFAYVYLDPQNPPKEIMLQWNDGVWEHRAYWGADAIPWGQAGKASRLAMGALPEAGKWARLEVPAEKVGLKPGQVVNGWAFTQFDGTVYWDKAGVVTTPKAPQSFKSQLAWEQFHRAMPNSSLPKPELEIVKLAPEKRSDAQRKSLRAYFLEHVCAETRGVFDPLHKELDGLNKRLEALEKSLPSTLVSLEMNEPKQAYVLVRGAYDRQGEKVERGVPASLPPLSPEAPRNRLGFAQWLVSEEHPLTARVTVNRFWQHYFGLGLVKTAEDFGSQGDWPSHPALLDWLATEFIESGWDVKHVQKLIVMSATYRQASRATPEKLEKDIDNRLLSRGPRFRMDAEMVRDNALAISGLLVGAVGGPSVKPYQPTGLWKAVGYTNSNTANFKQDHGSALYRRSMYTFWKRTSPPPSMTTFDAPSRETCTVSRPRTNTPLQALVMMNDVQFFEAARNFGQRIMTEGGATPAERVTFAFRLATARRPNQAETRILLEQFKSHLETYKKQADAAEKLVSYGESPRDESLDVSELAAWTMVANLILNLDETVTKG